MNYIEKLENSINENMSLSEIVELFEKFCEEPINDDMILFETGTFNFTGEELFYFSLSRQFPNDEEEYYQIHVDVLYKPTDDNKSFSEAVWNEDIDGNIFDYIRESKVYELLRNERYCKIDIYMDET